MSEDFVGARAKIVALTAANKILMEDLGKRGVDLLREYGVAEIQKLSDGDNNLVRKAIDHLEDEILTAR